MRKSLNYQEYMPSKSRIQHPPKIAFEPEKSETSGPAIRQEIPRLTSIIIPYIKIKSNKKHPQM